MENKVLTPEEEKELLEKAEKAPSNVSGQSVTMKDRGIVREDGYETTTPAELGKNKDKDVGEIE